MGKDEMDSLSELSEPCDPPVEWPEDGSPASFEDLAVALRSALDDLYVLERKSGGVVRWIGPTLKEESPEWRLSPEQLKYDEDNQGRDAARVLMAVALMLGIEQGQRIERQGVRERLGYAPDMLEIALRMVKQELTRGG